MENERRKLFVIRQWRTCKFMPNMHQLRFVAGICPDPLREFMCSPRLPNHNGCLLLREERGGRDKEGNKREVREIRSTGTIFSLWLNTCNTSKQQTKNTAECPHKKLGNLSIFREIRDDSMAELSDSTVPTNGICMLRSCYEHNVHLSVNNVGMDSDHIGKA